MRVMVTGRVPTRKGSEAISDGSMTRIIQRTLEQIRPESAYFFVEHGVRTMRAVFDMTESMQSVTLFEPLIMELEAEIELIPVMNAEELTKGFAALH